VSSSAVEIRLFAPLSGFDLDVEIATEARCLGVFGPSGSGKTSLLESVAGWRPTCEGRVRLGERVLFDSALGVRSSIEARAIGYVPQDALLFPHWNVRRNVLSGARAAPADLERAVDILEIGPLLDRSTSTLSGGERSRVALARALCSRPEVLLLDEPFGALDLPLRRRILPYLLRTRDAYDLPTLFVSHDPTDVQALCDVVAVIDHGRVCALGRPSEVLHGHGMPARGYENVLDGRVVEVTGGTARVEVAAGVHVQVPAAGLRPGERAVIALGADEILVSIAPLTGISARNIVSARIAEIEARGEDVTLNTVLGNGAAPARLRVGLTQASTRELGLEVGSRVVLVFKTQSCRILSPATESSDAVRERV
jgi:molybdate transport system ATP-binding protein